MPVLIPLLIALTLFAGIGWALTHQEQEIKTSHINLGQKYLQEMDYSSAAAEFLLCLSEDPTSQNARLGLAQACCEMGDIPRAKELMEPLLANNSVGAYQLLVTIDEKSSQSELALMHAKELADLTDNQQDYAKVNELLSQVLGSPHSYDAGADFELLIRNQTVYSRGSNLFGQLGSSAMFGTDESSLDFASADFPGTAERVYCAGRTAYVVDTGGNLWAAGENRWGQMGVNAVSVTSKPGWTQITDSGDISCVAGNVGTLYVMKSDGTLWYAGQGGVLSLTQVKELGQISEIAADGDCIAVLTLAGELYQKNGVNDAWKRAAKNVCHFSLCDGRLTWVTMGNAIKASENFALPKEWGMSKDGILADFPAAHAFSNGSGLLVQNTDGTVVCLNRGKTVQITKAGTIYIAGRKIVLENNEGVFLVDLAEASMDRLSTGGSFAG